MPEIARFHGIVITMYYDDHRPPHFHARHGENEAIVAIHPVRFLRGSLAPAAEALVSRWARARRGELEANWQRARAQVPLELIPPLD